MTTAPAPSVGPPPAGSAARPTDFHAVRLAIAALSGLIWSAVTMVWLHVGYADQISVINQTVSYYVFPDGGDELFAVSTLSLAAALALLVLGLARSGISCRGAVSALVVAATGAMVLLVAFPTDETGGPLSFSGQVHRYAGVCLFVSVPLLGYAIARRLREHPQWSSTARTVRWLSYASAAAAVTFLLSHAPVLLPDSAIAELFGGVQLHGLVERVLLAFDMALVSALALGLLRVSRPRRPRSGHPTAAADLELTAAP